MKKIAVLFICIALLAFGGVVFAGQGDNVLSENIKEADGTTGQDTNSGSGVKTGHIQDGAVTSSKLTNGSVTSPKIADGAVTDAKITGPISASKISSTGLNADTVDGKHASDLASAIHTHDQSDVNGLLDALSSKAAVNHNHDAVYQKKYANVIVVANSGGDFTDPIAAYASIVDASAIKPYLIKIMPGVYEVPFASFILTKDYIDIEGSGPEITKITSNSGYLGGGMGVLNYQGGNNNELRDISIECFGDYGPTGIQVTTATPFFNNINIAVIGRNAEGLNVLVGTAKISNANIYLDGGNGVGSATGIRASQEGSILLENVTIYGTHATYFTGVMALGGSSILKNVDISSSDISYSSWGIHVQNYNNTAGNIRIYNSTIEDISGALKAGSGSTLLASSTQFDAYDNTGGGIIKLVNCFNGNFDPIPNQ